MKRYFYTMVCTALLLGVLAVGSPAQQKVQPVDASQTTEDQSQDPQLKISPLRALQQLEPPPEEAYSLGAGDTISVYVAGHSELSKDYVIGPDGFITLDVIGSVKVLNLTREAAAKAVRDALAPDYTDPAVTIGVEKYGSNTVMIFGNVSHPGILTYDGSTPTLLDAIGRGGLLVNPSSKDGLPDRCIIYRGNDTVVPVALRQLLLSNSPLSDVRLRRGDKIFVPVDQLQFVSVLGQVAKPGPVSITSDLDLKMTLSRAGGITDQAGSNPTIHIIQTASDRELTITFNELMKPGGGREVTLQPGDVVFIPMSGFNKVTYFLTKLSPVATMVSLASLVVP
jgi:polysaccharide biosynthesis/export protein